MWSHKKFDGWPHGDLRKWLDLQHSVLARAADSLSHQITLQPTTGARLQCLAREVGWSLTFDDRGPTNLP